MTRKGQFALPEGIQKQLSLAVVPCGYGPVLLLVEDPDQNPYLYTFKLPKTYKSLEYYESDRKQLQEQLMDEKKQLDKRNELRSQVRSSPKKKHGN